MQHKNNSTRKLVIAATCMALAFVLPFWTGQIPQIGKMLLPMHFPVLLCGFVCGWPYALLVGMISPIARSLVLTMPPLMPTAVAMMFEMGTYGFVSGYLYNKFKQKDVKAIYISLVAAMICGRAVWGVVRFFLAGFNTTTFNFSLFLAGAFTSAIPGIVAQLVIVPVLVLTLKKMGFVEHDGTEKHHRA